MIVAAFLAFLAASVVLGCWLGVRRARAARDVDAPSSRELDEGPQ